MVQSRIVGSDSSDSPSLAIKPARILRWLPGRLVQIFLKISGPLDRDGWSLNLNKSLLSAKCSAAIKSASLCLFNGRTLNRFHGSNQLSRLHSVKSNSSKEVIDSLAFLVRGATAVG